MTDTPDTVDYDLLAARIRLFEEDRLRTLITLAVDGRRGMTQITRFDILDMAIVISKQADELEHKDVTIARLRDALKQIRGWREIGRAETHFEALKIIEEICDTALASEPLPEGGGTTVEREGNEAAARFLRNLADRLMHISIEHGVDQYDVEMCNDVAEMLERR